MKIIQKANFTTVKKYNYISKRNQLYKMSIFIQIR